jgi:hypothetical protein
MQALLFEGNEIRVETDERGDLWWIAADVCSVLGLENSSRALMRLPESEKGITESNTLRGLQSMLQVNEPGLYRLIFTSQKPEAEAFKLWVFREVLPSIRKTGRYTMTPDSPLPAPAREHAEVSAHLVRVWALARDTDDWLTSADVAHRAAVAPRTARAHLKYLLDLGLLDVLEAHPHHLYRAAPNGKSRHAAAYERLELIASVLQRRQPRLPALER